MNATEQAEEDALEPIRALPIMQLLPEQVRELLIGSFEAGKMEFKPALLEIRPFAQRLVEEILSATKRKCPIEFLLTGIPTTVHVDERLLRHIFTNLLTNAVKYSDPERAVQLEIAGVNADIVCTICDQGIGIPEADLEWLFHAFHRGFDW